jgi:hypothetical protein
MDLVLPDRFIGEDGVYHHDVGSVLFMGNHATVGCYKHIVRTKRWTLTASPNTFHGESKVEYFRFRSNIYCNKASNIPKDPLTCLQWYLPRTVLRPALALLKLSLDGDQQLQPVGNPNRRAFV